MTQIIKASSDAELLALIPRVAGYTASNSIVCVAFGGKRTVGAFRVNMPAQRRLADYRKVSTVVAKSLDRMPGADGVAVAIYTDLTFEQECGIPWLGFERQLTTRLHKEGFTMKGAFCVAPDGWASYFDRDYPRAGRPLDEIEPSEPVPDLAGFARLHEVSVAEQQLFLQQLVHARSPHSPHSPTSPHSPSELGNLAGANPIELVEAILAWEGPLPRALEVELVHLAQSPARRDVISLQVAFGELVAEAVEHDNENYLRVQAGEGGSMDQVVLREVSAGRASLDDEFASLLMGRGHVRPDLQRTDRMIELLRRVIPLAPEPHQPGLLCIVAYLLWARGLSSAAATFIAMALQINPDYGMAQIMHTMLDHGMVPEWLFG